MYAVISTGGKQYRLEQGDLIEVESLKGEVGDKVVFNEVLALGDENAADFGSPLIDGAQVIGTIVDHGKGAKVRVVKFKRRKMYRKRTGHRQRFTSVKIDSILSGGGTEVPAEKKTPSRKRKSAESKGGEKAPEKSAGTAKKGAAQPRKAKPAAKKPAAKRAEGAVASEAKKTASKTKTKPESKSEAKEPQE
jgi:large subunit ribosomal protein L21